MSGLWLGLGLGLGLSSIRFYPSPSPSLCLSPIRSALALVSTAHAQDAGLLDAGADQIVKRAFVPSEERKVGEVRLIRRRDAKVVQTLLYSKVLRQVVGEIRKKELANWPLGRTGHDDAVRYADTLQAVQKTLWNRMREDRRIHDRRQTMLIELVLAPDGALVLIGSFEMGSKDGAAHVEAREVMATLPLSRDYIERNQRLIAADSFGLDPAAVDLLFDTDAPAKPHP